MILALVLAAAAALGDPPAPASDSPADLASLKQLYDQSCGSRGYAEYDDICNQISQQMREAEREAARRPRAKAAPDKSAGNAAAPAMAPAGTAPPPS